MGSTRSAGGMRGAGAAVRAIRPVLRAASTALGLATLALCAPALALGGTGGTGAISGKVTGPAGKPLPPNTQVSVMISPESGRPGSAYAEESEYKINELASGTYQVSFYAPGYIKQYYEDVSAEAYATPVTVTAGDTDTGIDAELQLAGEISGRVTNIDGAALAKISVSAYDSAGAGGTAETNASGEYTVGSLPAGAYTVRFAPAAPVAGFSTGGGNYLPQFYNARSSGREADTVRVDPLVPNEATTGIDATLAAGGTISGRVVDPSGTPVEGLLVTAYTPVGGFAGSWFTEADGRYSIDQLPSGSYAIGVAPSERYGSRNYVPYYYPGRGTLAGAAAVVVRAGSEVEIDPTVTAGGEITGTVTAPKGGGVKQARVVLLNERDEYVAGVSTNDEGKYAIGALEAGSYFVEFLPPFKFLPEVATSGENFLGDFFSGASSLETARLVSVTVGTTTPEVNGTLGEGGELTGTVTTAGKKPVPNITVTAYESDGDSAGSVLTGPNGEYTIGGLSGSYRLEFSARPGLFPGSSPGNYAPVFSGGASSLEHAAALAVTVGEVTPYDAELQTGGSISGVVTGRGGAGVGGVRLWASDSGGSATGASTSGATTSLNGAYTITGLAAGSYTISAQDGTSGRDELDYFPLTDAATAKVSDGAETPGVDIQLTTGGTIAGTVTDSSGAGLAGFVIVSVQDEDGQSGFVPLIEGASGYSIGALPPGKYTVCFEDETAGPAVGYEPDCIGGTSRQTATTFDVTSGEVTTVPATKLTLYPGSISGAVTDANGNGARAQVTVYEENGAGVAASVTTAANGAYTVAGLAPGFYRVDFALNAGGGGFYGGGSSLGEAGAILVASGATAEGIDYGPSAHGESLTKSTTTTTTTTTSPGKGHAAVKPRPLTEAEKRAKAIAACAKLKKSKRAKCVTAAKKRFPLKASKPKGKARAKAKPKAKKT